MLKNLDVREPKQRVLIADDHRLIRDAIAAPLRSAGFEVSVSEDYTSTLHVIEEEGRFDVVLLDVNMPGIDGEGPIKSVINGNDPGAVVLFSGSVSKRLVARALADGAKGFIPKTISLRALENALWLISSGENFVPYNFFESGQDSESTQGDGTSVATKLTERELKVLYGASVGQSNKEIAFDLSLSEVTVKMHMRSICSKLGAKNRTQAAMVAKQAQLI